jgi:hypothetical protein
MPRCVEADDRESSSNHVACVFIRAVSRNVLTAASKVAETGSPEPWCAKAMCKQANCPHLPEAQVLCGTISYIDQESSEAFLTLQLPRFLNADFTASINASGPACAATTASHTLVSRQ